MANIIVSGAGSTEVNGTYVDTGQLSGNRPVYVNNANSDIGIVWDSGAWMIMNPSTRVIYYYSSNNVATPDLCTTWEVYSGESPVPTVTKGVTGVPKHFLYYARMRGN